MRRVRSLQIRLFTLALYITVTARHVKNRRLAACLRLCFYLFWKSSFVHDTQLPVDLAPVPDGSCPFLSSLESGQI